MAEQSVDLRSALSMLRRRWRVLVVATLAGMALGVVLVRPPMYSSTAQVLLTAETSTSGGPPVPRDISTDVRVAESDAVLAPAGEKMDPPLDRLAVARLVSAGSVSNDILQIEARGSSPEQAESLAQAVAESEVAYQQSASSSLSAAEQADLDTRQTRLQEQLQTVGSEIAKIQDLLASESPGSPRWRDDRTAVANLTAQQSQLLVSLGQIKIKLVDSQDGPQAKVIQSATPAKRPMLPVWYAVTSIVVGLIALALTAVTVIVVSRRDRRLRTRDEIADALGSPVIGSLQTRTTPRTAAAWSALLESYHPTVVDAWSLRQALDKLGVGDLFPAAKPTRTTAKRTGTAAKRTGTAAKRTGTAAKRTGTADRIRPLTVVVVVLSDDLGGLVATAQLAAHTASLGVGTLLTPLTRHEVADPLWAAGWTHGRGEPVCPNLWVDLQSARPSVDLTIELVAVERQDPDLPDLRQADAVVLAISSGAAGEDDLARVAVTAYEAGGRFLGAIVADPDDLDRTTGRLLQAQRATEMSLPVRLTGLEPRAQLPTDRSAT